MYCSFVQRFTPTTVKRLVDYSVLFVLRACTEQKLFSAISEAERRATRGEKEGRANPATVHSGEQNRLVMVQVRTKGASPLANRRRRGGDAGTGNIAPGKPVPVFSSATGGWRSLVANSELIPTWRVWDRHLNWIVLIWIRLTSACSQYCLVIIHQTCNFAQYTET